MFTWFSLILNFRWRMVIQGVFCFAVLASMDYIYLASTCACSYLITCSHFCQATLYVWHARLGHPSTKILTSVLSRHDLVFTKSSDFSCDFCHCIKSHKLPFYESSITSYVPLELIYSDVWTSLILSFDGYKYYVIFVDHFTKYIWLYPLKHKSDVFATFIAFKALAEHFFKAKITILYYDNKAEYIALRHFLITHGITHLTTPSHTPENNGASKHRHCHIFYTDLALLHQASMPFSMLSA